MQNSLRFTNRYPYWIHLLALIIYYLLVVLPHQQVGRLIAITFNSKLRSRYDLIFQVIAFICLGVVLIILARYVKKLKTYPFALLYTLITLVLIGVSAQFLFTLNVEFVHFVQYGIFVLLCFPLTHSLTQTYIWATLAGVLDELYQYVILTPGADYFDFNDIVLNMIGAGFGLIIARIVYNDFQKISWQVYFRTFQSKVLSLIILLIIVMFILGYISYGPDENSILVLFKKPYNGFWSIIPPQVKVHVIKPMEGLVIIFFLMCFYVSFDKLSIKEEK